jgi:hypothetical protein
MTLSQAQKEMIESVTSKMSANEIRKYVEYFDGSKSAPEHDEIIVTAALQGDATAMLLCHMA